MITPYGRPYLPGNFDFNISHSGRLVVCAAANRMKVGVDVEWIQPIPLYEYAETFTYQQAKMIQQSKDPIKTFYRIWTMKESLLKAIGTGLLMSPEEIESDFKTFRHETNNYYFKELFIDHRYCGFLTATKKNSTLIVEKVIL